MLELLGSTKHKGFTKLDGKRLKKHKMKTEFCNLNFHHSSYFSGLVDHNNKKKAWIKVRIIVT
ncbi:hypothetical protein Hanom_Chr10g00957161 [Helianthus anomalus]